MGEEKSDDDDEDSSVIPSSLIPETVIKIKEEIIEFGETNEEQKLDKNLEPFDEHQNAKILLVEDQNQLGLVKVEIDGLFQCSSCKVGFSNETSLNVHISSVHEGKNRT